MRYSSIPNQPGVCGVRVYRSWHRSTGSTQGFSITINPSIQNVCVGLKSGSNVDPIANGEISFGTAAPRNARLVAFRIEINCINFRQVRNFFAARRRFINGLSPTVQYNIWNEPESVVEPLQESIVLTCIPPNLPTYGFVDLQNEQYPFTPGYSYTSGVGQPFQGVMAVQFSRKNNAPVGAVNPVFVTRVEAYVEISQNALYSGGAVPGFVWKLHPDIEVLGRYEEYVRNLNRTALLDHGNKSEKSWQRIYQLLVDEYGFHRVNRVLFLDANTPTSALSSIGYTGDDVDAR